MQKLHCLLMLPSLDISCKSSVPRKPVQLYSPWCHCSQLCCHQWGVLVIDNPECVSRLLMLEIRVPHIHLLWPTIQPLRRIRKELPPKIFFLACRRRSNLSTPIRGQRSSAARLKVECMAQSQSHQESKMHQI